MTASPTGSVLRAPVRGLVPVFSSVSGTRLSAVPESSLPSPKQRQALTKRDWYPYYAGYRLAFAVDTIERYAPTAHAVVDPWNGSGTTTEAAQALGVASTGVDINPAMSVVAHARSIAPPPADEVKHRAAKLLKASHRTQLEDPLRRWFGPRTAARIRGMQRELTLDIVEVAGTPSPVDRLLNDNSASLFMTALFATARTLIAPFRSSNPTWINRPADADERLEVDDDALDTEFLRLCAHYRDLLRMEESSTAVPMLWCGDWSRVDSPRYDACLTSPPYATRIDYPISTLAELAVLGVGEDQISALRRASLGGPVVRGVRSPSDDDELISQTVSEVLAAVWKHSSKGSQGYYHPWLRNYFGGLQESIATLIANADVSFTLMMVVQGSFFKEVRIDLPKIVTEIGEGLGLATEDRVDYPAVHLISRKNPGANKSSKTSAVESLIVMRKEPQ